jgi:DNA replication protein DnaC
LAVNIDDLREIAAKRDRYQGQLNRIRKLGKQTSCIEAAVASACETLNAGTTSFVIYGEPQSGKTEMMICLTAKLLDDGSSARPYLSASRCNSPRWGFVGQTQESSFA